MGSAIKTAAGGIMGASLKLGKKGYTKLNEDGSTSTTGMAGSGMPVNDVDTRNTIQRDITMGQSLFAEDFKEGAFGRLDEGRSDDMTSIIEAKRASLEGLSAQENQALRERANQGINTSTQTALRSMRGQQGMSGIRGATAGAQQGSIVQAGQQSKANAERDLLIKNIDTKRENLAGFEQSVQSAEEAEEARKLFNLEQSQAETFGRMSAGLGFAQIGASDRAAQMGVASASAIPTGTTSKSKF